MFFEAIPSTAPLHSLLEGDQAFYNKEVSLDFNDPLKPADYRVDLDNRIYIFAKTLFDYTIGLPITTIHSLLGYLMLPASFINAVMVSPEGMARQREDTIQDLNRRGFEVKPLKVDIDGYMIDAQIVGKKETLNNGKWTLFSGGNAMFCNEHYPNAIENFIELSNNNLITFNYPSVGFSQGAVPSKQACVKAMQGLLKMLEDKKLGLGAKEITLWGLSLGGGIVGEALKHHTPQEGVKYVAVKDRTFSNLSGVVYNIGTEIATNFPFPDLLKTLVVYVAWIATKIFGWDLNSEASLDNFKGHEIILQTVTKETLDPTEDKRIVEISDVNDIELNDGIIAKDVSLANAILSQRSKENRANISVLGVSENHFEPFMHETQKVLSEKIAKIFQSNA